MAMVAEREVEEMAKEAGEATWEEESREGATEAATVVRRAVPRAAVPREVKTVEATKAAAAMAPAVVGEVPKDLVRAVAVRGEAGAGVEDKAAVRREGGATEEEGKALVEQAPGVEVARGQAREGLVMVVVARVLERGLPAVVVATVLEAVEGARWEAETALGGSGRGAGGATGQVMVEVATGMVG